MSTIDRAALIEQAAQELAYPSFIAGVPVTIIDNEMRDEVAKVLPVIAKALLAPLRELHVGYCATCALLHPCPTVRLLDAIEAEVQA